MVANVKETNVTKKRKVSKKTKKSWRKHVSIKDVDEFLDEKRFEERLGPPITERSDSELFTVENEPTEPAPFTSKQQRRLRLKNKEPMCFNSLKPHTAVPDPISKRNTVKNRSDSTDILVKRRVEIKRLNKESKVKKRAALEEQNTMEKNKDKTWKKHEFNKNIWLEETKLNLGPKSEWLTTDTIRHTLTNTGQKRKRVPLSVWKKTSVLPSVEAPNPGTSYNPAYDDHQALLSIVAKQEMKLMKEEAHLNRVTTKMFQKVTAEKREQSWMAEMSQGLPKKHDAENQKLHNEIDDGVLTSVNPPAKNAKKTLVKRRKQKEQRELEMKRKHARVEKKKVADIYKLKNLANQIAGKEKKEETLRKKRELVKAKKLTEPKVLGRVKFEAPDPDFALAEELAPNLRSSKPIGNLLKDRYKSLQQRNILAPGVRLLKRNKAKVKKFEKASHKMGWEDTFK